MDLKSGITLVGQAGASEEWLATIQTVSWHAMGTIDKSSCLCFVIHIDLKSGRHT